MGDGVAAEGLLQILKGRIHMSPRVSFRRLLAIAIGLSLLCGVLTQFRSDLVFAMAARPPVVGTPAPDFALPTLAGETLSLSQHRGKIVLLNFWATWCKPCVKEMPAMQTVYEDLRDQGFVVLAINELEDEAKVRAHISEHGHTFPVLLDHNNRVANMYGVRGLPVSVFVDRAGRVRDFVKGGLLTEPIIRKTVTRILTDHASTTDSPIS